ncbi:uncharacterized protein LOC115633903 [Scaptodrosophila lebanonensis]|uniref:Uncharacterized protein LOC115633903 n=1 Tax=Drosophila lebanonensis TaxID=7225 RepID=A0A6J2UJ76_DROLE|nr:uncharacterized protein LOC115633903 [Scaptodrosophila lebanonensis]
MRQMSHIKPMERKQYAEDRQNFVSTRMSLPLFMLARNRLREDHLQRTKKQFKLAGEHYNKYCKEENRGEAASAATYEHYKHITGFDKLPDHPYPERRPLFFDRNKTTFLPWQQAPNRYGVPPVPFLSQSGTKGTVFQKLHSNKSIKPPVEMPYQFYEVPTSIECMSSPENRHKGVFLSNARDRRPTSRFMVSNPTSCWRNPNEPGATSHYTKYYELAANIKSVIKEQPPNPHLFLRHSCVPTKPNLLIRRHLSFEPAVGRYDVRFPNVCPCAAGKISVPNLQILINDQKRLKFRRLPYTRISSKQLCEPDWRHVVGKGHTYRFRMSKRDMPRIKLKKTAAGGKKPEKHLNMFADAKYLNMLTQPQRAIISKREIALPPYTPRIVFNSVAKRVVRKQLRNNKKIAFNSGQERFKDADRPMQLTVRQLEAIKARLPPERRLVDRPLDLRKSTIVSKLMQVPDHQKVAYMPKLRKRLFKFLPVPAARVLVTDSDIKPDIPYDPDHPTGLFRQRLDERTFFRDSVLEQLMKTEKVQIEKDSNQTSNMSITSKASKHSLRRHGSKRFVLPAE